LQIDTDGAVEVIPFDSRVWAGSTVNLNNYQQASRNIWKQHQMGSTNLAAALNTVLKEAAKTREPIVAVVITDGDPDDRQAATRVVCDLARYPVFLKFLALRSVPYLQELDDLEQVRPGARLLDNVDAKAIYAGMSDAEFAEAMVDEWDSWLAAATQAGVLR